MPVGEADLADLVRELVERGRLPHDRAFSLIGAVLDRVDDTDLVQHRYTASALLAVTEAAVRLQDRVTGFARDLVGVADVADAAPLAYGTSLSSWLSHRFPIPTRAAHRLVKEAQVGARGPATTVAVQRGTVRPEQALVVCDVMRALPVADPVTATEVEAVLLDWATTMIPNDLRSMGAELVERLDPDLADDLLGRAVERAYRRADRRCQILCVRGCSWTPEEEHREHCELSGRVAVWRVFGAGVGSGRGQRDGHRGPV